MLETLLLITSLTTGTVDIMSFADPISCYNYAQRNQNDNYSLQCVPAGNNAVDFITQNYYNTSRVVNIVRNLTSE